MDLFEEAKTVADVMDMNADAIVLQGDVIEVCDKLPAKQFQMIVSSPPYNIGKSYEEKQGLEDYLLWQSGIAKCLTRLLSDNGSLVWQVGNYVENGEVFPLDIHFYPIFKRLGLKLRNRIIWHFDHGLHASKRFSGRYETLLWFTKTDDYIFNLDAVRVPSKYPGKRHYKGEKIGKLSGNPLGKNPSDFWTFMQEEFAHGVIDVPNVKANHPEKTIHPCQFPVELVERCVLAFTQEADWVLDPFCGVGSSLLAAIKNKRRSEGIDRDPAYCQLAQERLRELSRHELRLRPIGKPVYQPTGKEQVAQISPEWRDGGLQ